LFLLSERNTDSLSFKHFIMIVCPCSLQILWWSSNMCLKINGGKPNAGRGLSLKKIMNIREFGIVSSPQGRGIHLYGVLLVRLTSHIWLTKWLPPYLKFVDEVESKGKNQIYRKWGLQIYRDCIILFSNELSLHLTQYMYDYWSIKLFSDILCDSPTTIINFK
jgi:hypothetical protein